MEKDSTVNTAARILGYIIKFDCGLHIKPSLQLEKILRNYITNLDDTCYNEIVARDLVSEYGKITSSEIMLCNNKANAFEFKIKFICSPQSISSNEQPYKYIIYLPLAKNILVNMMINIIVDILDENLQFLMCLEDIKAGVTVKSFCKSLFAKPMKLGC